MSTPLINFNSKRLRIYPLIILITTWLIVAINFLTRTGWQGGYGQIIGIDYLTHYTAGQLYRFDIDNLYDYDIQGKMQQEMISPAPFEGVGPFLSPPYVAFAYSWFTYIPYKNSFLLWLILSLLFVVASIPILNRLIPSHSTYSGLSKLKLLIILLSFFPLVNGWLVGQNHTLTLLLVSGMMLSILYKKPILAGSLAGLLIYKPQFILGILIIWLVWGEYRAILSFVVVSGSWVLATLHQYGIDPYLEYLRLSSILLNLPYMPGYPGYLQITTYGFLTTFLPISMAPFLQKMVYVMMLVYGVGLAYIAYITRNKSIGDRLPVIITAMLFPFIVTPYALFHDLLLLFPLLFLWAKFAEERFYLLALIIFYFGGIVMPVVGFYLQVAIMAIIPIIILIGQTRPLMKFKNNSI